MDAVALPVGDDDFDVHDPDVDHLREDRWQVFLLAQRGACQQ
ncbi:MAG: hypothetical protein OXG81_15550 [Acidobacteria bacterium]|nr:hypothetical protein [Acidobacteriota bacterium]